MLDHSTNLQHQLQASKMNARKRRLTNKAQEEEGKMEQWKEEATIHSSMETEELEAAKEHAVAAAHHRKMEALHREAAELHSKLKHEGTEQSDRAQRRANRAWNKASQA